LAGVLKPPSANDHFDRRLMTTWLNIVNGAVEYTAFVDTNGGKVPDTSVGAALTSIEAIRLTPGVTKTQLLAQIQLLKLIDKVDEN
jgi:glycine cleavage system aminomethyltransferase T